MFQILKIVLFLSLFTISNTSANDVYNSLKNVHTARSMGMGNAQVAIATGVEALRYNPAGLSAPAFMGQFDKLDYRSSTYELNEMKTILVSPFALSYRHIRFGDDNNVTTTTYGYGRKGNNGFNWGLSYKMINVNTVGLVESGWSADIGLQMHLTSQINMGILLRDAIQDKIKVPSTIEVGTGVNVNNLTIALDLKQNKEDSKNQTWIAHSGLEYDLNNGLIFRGGAFQDVLTLGATLQLPIIDIDWAIAKNIEKNNRYNYMIGFKLGRAPVKQKVNRRYTLFKPKQFAFEVGGNVVGGQSSLSLLGGFRVGSNDLLNLINKANEDPTCMGFAIRLHGMSGSLGSLGMVQEIRHALKKAKKNGKKIYVFINHWATLPDYYLASIADKIMMPTMGTLSHLGIELEIKKTKSLLSRWGMDVDVVSSGKYKVDTMPETGDLSKESKQMLTTLIDDVYDNVLADIRESRDLNWKEVKTLFDGRLISGKEAKKKGLVDEVGYWNEFEYDLNGKSKKVKKVDRSNC